MTAALGKARLYGMHEDLIPRLSEALSQTPELRALFLSGSYGDGSQDNFSDIDFLAITTGTAEAAATVTARWLDALRETETLVLTRTAGQRAQLTNVVTEAWLRLDLLARDAAALQGHGRNSLRPLYDPQALFATLPDHATLPDPRPRLTYAIEEIFRLLGLLPVGLGRAELAVSQTGVFHLRALLTELMIADSGARPRGVLSLSQQLDADSLSVLETLPLPIASPPSIIAAHQAHTAALLPLARKLAARHGIDWPTALEDATRARWDRELGTDF